MAEKIADIYAEFGGDEVPFVEACRRAREAAAGVAAGQAKGLPIHKATDEAFKREAISAMYYARVLGSHLGPAQATVADRGLMMLRYLDNLAVKFSLLGRAVGITGAALAGWNIGMAIGQWKIGGQSVHDWLAEFIGAPERIARNTKRGLWETMNLMTWLYEMMDRQRRLEANSAEEKTVIMRRMRRLDEDRALRYKILSHNESVWAELAVSDQREALEHQLAYERSQMDKMYRQRLEWLPKLKGKELSENIRAWSEQADRQMEKVRQIETAITSYDATERKKRQDRALADAKEEAARLAAIEFGTVAAKDIWKVVSAQATAGLNRRRALAMRDWERRVIEENPVGAEERALSNTLLGQILEAIKMTRPVPAVGR